MLGSLNVIRNSDLSGNLSTGLALLSSSATQVYGNTISNNAGLNSHGIQVTKQSGDPQTLIGQSDLSLSQGNRIFNNGGVGVLASGNVLIVGNTIYGHAGNNMAGLSISGGVVADSNVIFGNNSGGIVTGNSTVTNNRIYNNLNYGLNMVGSGGIAERNVIYSNAIGMQVASGTVRNNLIYDNTLRGLAIEGASATVLSNTIHQAGGEAVRVAALSGLQLRNNILWSDGNLGQVALLVTAPPAGGAVMDTNAFYVTNSQASVSGVVYGTRRSQRFSRPRKATSTAWLTIHNCESGWQ